MHPEANKIEKLLLSLINKTIIKQKVKGEPLVQKSSAFYDGLFELNLDIDKMSPAARDAAVKKYMGSNFLPTYHVSKNGNTAAMKVAISLQGDYESLLNLAHQIAIFVWKLWLALNMPYQCCKCFFNIVMIYGS